MKLRGRCQQMLVDEVVPSWRSTATGGRYKETDFTVDPEIKKSEYPEFAGEADTGIDRSSEQAENVSEEVNNFEEYGNRCDIMARE